jgi:serine/threonine-protein kinase
VPDSSTTPPDDRPDLAGDETMPVPARKDTLAAPGGTDFRHGRFEPGERLGSRYRIVARLGEGGMGEVYRADDLELGQSVALKFLPERVAADESWLRRFRNEVRTARQIAHPNVCRIYDIGQEDGHVLLSMEYVDGEDLSGVLRRLGRPSREKAIEIARQICLGLAAAHDAKVLHRDLKPANIMIDGRGRVRITDFGLAGFLDELEGVEARAGTPAYMAPEQLTNGEVSVRSDIYTLGLILHELFTGQCVFDTNDVEALKRQHTSGSVAPPSSTTEEIDPAVERVIMRCLEANPEHRPQSVYQLLAALPGGDPLAAALAAGEMPSPELVANARDAGGLRPRTAVGLVVAVLTFLAITYAFYAGTTVMPERSPAVLSVVAGQILEELGYVDLPRASVSGYDINAQLYKSLRSSPRPYEALAELDWPPRFRYWRRWTDGRFEPSHFHLPEEFAFDGPTRDSTGTATVALDSTGRLIELLVAPSLSEASPVPLEDIDWSPVFDLANLDESDATEVPLERRPPVDCDEVVAWRIEGPEKRGDSVTVQMGAAGGRPNYFEYLGIDGMMVATHDKSSATTMEWNVYVSTTIEILMVVFALYNMRRGRGDRRNAFRCALLLGGLFGLLELLSFPLAGPIHPYWIIDSVWGRAGGHILIHALVVWVMYMAVEPYVRKIWPRMLVGLVRLLSGRLRDPAVGREVLIGVVAGCGLIAMLALTHDLQWRFQADLPGQLPASTELWSRMSPAVFLAMNAHNAAWTVTDVYYVIGLLIAIRFLTRHSLVTTVLGILAIGFMAYLWFMGSNDESMWLAAAYAIGFGVVVVLLFTRAGVLAGIVALFVLRPHRLFTTDFDAWFTAYGMADLAILLVLATYGFWVSLAGQPMFKDMLAEPQTAA